MVPAQPCKPEEDVALGCRFERPMAARRVGVQGRRRRHPDARLGDACAVDRAWDVMLEAALRLEGVEQGIACEGTAVESRTVKTNGRAFLFLSPKKAYFKLGPSYPEAQEAAKAGEAVRPGAGGWTSLMWDAPCPVSPAVLRRWVKESHDLVAAGPQPALRAGLLNMKPKGKAAPKAKRAPKRGAGTPLGRS